MVGRRLLRPVTMVAAVASLAVALSPASGQAPPGAERLCEGGSDAVLKKDRWTIYRQPEGLTKIIAHAAGREGRLLLATDGKTVMRSIDAGCHWEKAYDVTTPTGEGTPAEGQLPRVSRIHVIDGSGVVLLSLDGIGRAAGYQVLRSDEGGQEGTWTETEGAPSAPGVREFVTAPDAPDEVYLITGVADAVGQVEPTGSSGILYGSEDGGQTWELRSGGGGEIERLAVEADTGGQYLWIVRSNGTVFVSQDGGRTATPATMPPPIVPGPVPGVQEVPPPPDHWRDVAVFRFVHVQRVIIATAAPTREADVSRAVISLNGGATWEDIPVDGLGPAGGLVYGNGAGQVFSALPTDNPAYRGPGLVEFNLEEGRWVGRDELGLKNLKDPRMVTTPTEIQPNYRSLYLRADRPEPELPDLIVRYEPDAADDLPPTGRPKCGNANREPPKPKRIAFEPKRIDVELQPGQPEKVPVKGLLPPAPTPVDLFFMVDHSESMDPAVEGVNCSLERLIRELPERNLDMNFGLAGYNDLVRFTYRRLVDIKPPAEAGPEISEQLRKLFTLRGSQEPLRGALYQAMTGEGLQVTVANPEGPGRVDRKVDPGQHVNWRASDKVVRTILVITDEPYEEDSEGEPPLAGVIEKLKAKNVKVIGLQVVPGAQEQLNANDPDHAPHRQILLRQQLDTIARDTGTLAPRGGVDCDGGGTPDVQEGQPLVCRIDEAGIQSKMDDTLVSVMQALRQPEVAEVRLVPRRTDGLQASVEEGPVQLDLFNENDFASTAVLACTQEQLGERFELTFDVMAGERVVDTLEGSARCGTVPAVVAPVPRKAVKPKPEPQPQPEAPAPAKPPAPAPQPPAAVVPPAQAPQVAAVAAPPAAPPAPAPVQGAPAQAPAQAMAAQPGAAAQENRQVQVTAATVHADRDQSTAAEEHAMVRSQPVAFRPRSSVPTEAIVTLGVGFAGLLAYVGVGMAPRRRRDRLAMVEVDATERPPAHSPRDPRPRSPRP